MDVTSYLLGKQAGGGGGQPSLQNKSVTITENGTQNVTADTGYDGLRNVGITTNVQPNLETKSITITENTTTTITPTAGKDGLSSVEVITNVSGGDLNDYFTSTISAGTSTPTVNSGWYATLKKIPNLIINGTLADYMFCGYITDLPMLDMSSITTMQYFANEAKTTLIPLYNTSNVTRMDNAFQSCTNLTSVPLLNTSKVTNLRNAFNNCPNLTNTSLDNILQMCINSLVNSNKTLARLGFTSTNYPTSRIQALPHYQDFIDAGWTIGY